MVGGFGWTVFVKTDAHVLTKNMLKDLVGKNNVLNDFGGKKDSMAAVS